MRRHAHLDSWEASASGLTGVQDYVDLLCENAGEAINAARQRVDGHDVELRHGIAGLSGQWPARRIVFGRQPNGPSSGGLVELGPFFEGTGAGIP